MLFDDFGIDNIGAAQERRANYLHDAAAAEGAARAPPSGGDCQTSLRDALWYR